MRLPRRVQQLVTDRLRLAFPLSFEIVTLVIATLSIEPLVIFRRASGVILDLVLQQVGHVYSVFR